MLYCQGNCIYWRYDVRKRFRNRAGFHYCLLFLAIGLGSCSPKLVPSSPTSIPPQPTSTEPSTTESQFSPFKAGIRYADTSGDMAIPFLDVIAFRATVNEEAETLDVLLWMRDIPEMADRGQVTN